MEALKEMLYAATEALCWEAALGGDNLSPSEDRMVKNIMKTATEGKAGKDFLKRIDPVPAGQQQSDCPR